MTESLKLIWLTEPNEIIKIISSVYSEANDPPVFYSSGMLQAFSSISKIST